MSWTFVERGRRSVADAGEPPRYRTIVAHEQDAVLAPFDLLPAYREQDFAALLDAPVEGGAGERYAYLGTEPYWLLRSKRDRIWSGPPETLTAVRGDPLATLEALLKRWPTPPARPDLPPFVGGALGYLGYETLYQLERIPDTGRDDLAMPDVYLLFCGLVHAVDFQTRQSWIIATGVGTSAERADHIATERLQRGQQAAARAVAARTAHGSRAAVYRELLSAELTRYPRLAASDLAANQVTPTVTRAQYLAAIRDIQDNIALGNAFEVCLTQRFDGTTDVAGAHLYEVLRAVNPNPMAAYLRVPEGEVLSSSPERFVSLDGDGVAEARPIKGTRPRGRDATEDAQYRDDLASSVKDRAENVMIVDLLRNDLGKVCRFGSVAATDLFAIEGYEHTWQMVSTIRGQLRAGLGPVDLLRATLPGGSMTGAPKVAAMTLIDRLEPTKRGVYAGCIGFIGFGGVLDMNIVIRSFIKVGSHLSFHVGGAIVIDSDAEDEYQETLDKAKGLLLALRIAQHTKRLR